jgi:hypothetical protein
MSDFEYSNAADGACQQCGADTDEEWHAFCADCFAEQQGWRRPDRAELDRQHQDRQQTSLVRLIELVQSFEQRLEELHERVARLERHPGQHEERAA